MGNKPTMLYASPFPPQKSGISDYSAKLVTALSRIFDITLYTENTEIEDESLAHFPVVRDRIDNIDFDAYDYRVYNIGNNPAFHTYIYNATIKHPGMIILHDLSVYYLFVENYRKKNELFSKVYENSGVDAFLKIKHAAKKVGTENLKKQTSLASTVRLNEELLSSGNKIMVHSDFSKNSILKTGLVKEENIRKINHLSLISDNEEYIGKEELFDKFNIPKDAIVVSSLGFISDTKLNREVAEVILDICNSTERVDGKTEISNDGDCSQNRKICYVMVGSGDYADDLLKDGVIIKTGYADIKEFNSFVKHSDIIVNLRYPSMGETSGSMIRILQMGKICITNNGGWFSELPDDAVVKISLEEPEENTSSKLKKDKNPELKELNSDYVKNNLKNAILTLINDDSKKSAIEQNAREYIERDYNPTTIAEAIRDFLIN